MPEPSDQNLANSSQTPLSTGMEHLKFSDDGRVYRKQRKWFLILPLLAFPIVTFLFFVVTSGGIQSLMTHWPMHVVPFVVTGFYALVGIFVLSKLLTPSKAEIDLTHRMYYPNGRPKDMEGQLREGISLAEILELKVVRRRVRASKGGERTHYRLQLVRRTGEEFTFLEQGSDELLMEDARRLSEQTGLPLREDLETMVDEVPKPTIADVPKATMAAMREATESRKRGLQSRWPVLLMGLLFMGIGGGVGSWLFINPLIKTIRAKDWPSCPAIIISSSLSSRHAPKGGATYAVSIEYSYLAPDGSRHTSNALNFFEDGTSYTNVGVKGMRQKVDQYSAGTETTCLVNPDNPDQAVLERHVPFGSYFAAAFFSVFLLVGCFLFWLGARPKRAQQQ